MVILTGCLKKPLYEQTFERARVATNQDDKKRLALLALHQVETSGHICDPACDYIISFLMQTPKMSEADIEGILLRSIDHLKGAKCHNREEVLYSRCYLLGDYYYSLKQYEKAADFLADALYLGIKIRGKDDRSLAGIREVDTGPHEAITYPSSLYDKVADCFERIGRVGDAEHWRRRDLELHERYYGADGTSAVFGEGGVRDQISALARNLTLQGKLEEAEQLYLHSIDVAKHTLDAKQVGSVSFFCPVEFAGLAEVLRLQGKNEEAEAHFVEAERGFEINPRGPELEDMQSNHAKLLKDMGKTEEAKHLEDSLAATRALRGESSSRSD